MWEAPQGRRVWVDATFCLLSPVFFLAMIAGLPWTSWILLLLAVGLGLALELAFYFRHRK